MQQWEHETETPELGDRLFEWEYLKKRGEDGWELVSVVDSFHSYTGRPAKKYYFKRPIQPPSTAEKTGSAVEGMTDAELTKAYYEK